jgi:transposase
MTCLRANNGKHTTGLRFLTVTEGTGYEIMSVGRRNGSYTPKPTLVRTIAKALVGDYRPEHLFTLRQSLQGFRWYQKMIGEVDRELKKLLDELPRSEGVADQLPPRPKTCIYQRASNEPAFDLPAELYRISGVDLTDIPGISANTAQTILSEVGPNVSRFRNASAFASWLGLSPEKQISGGKTLRTKTRKVKNRAAIALRLGASCLYHAKNYLGEFFRA